MRSKIGLRAAAANSFTILSHRHNFDLFLQEIDFVEDDNDSGKSRC